jgi:sulfite exporter TauE/SafE
MVLSSLLGVDVLLFLTIGLLGGAHCIGMCGPLVTIYAQNMDGTRSDGGTQSARGRGRGAHLTLYEVRQHALFNVGRTLSYTLIGTLMGALGGVLFLSVDEVTTVARTVRGVVGVGIGALVVVIGGYYIAGRNTGGLHLPGAGRVTGWMTAWVERLAGGPGIMGLGALHGLLPCPILYPAYLYAFASGSPVAGGVALAALGLGTIPAVFLYGTLIESVDAVHRRRMHRVLGLVFVVLGYILFAHGLMSLGYTIPHPMFPFWDPLSMPASG